MKDKKIHISIFLVMVLVLSIANGFSVKAAENSVTITLRIEKDETTVATPVQVTLTDADTQTDYGLSLATGPVLETATPLHALAKYMISQGATEETMSRYIAADFTYGSAYITGISTKGKCNEKPYGSAASGDQDNVYWMFAVNDAAPIDPVTHSGCAADQYILKNNDQITFYGLWSAYPDETLYSYFDKTSYSIVEGSDITITLTGSGMQYDDQFHSVVYTKAVIGASVIVAECDTPGQAATRQNAMITALTDENGKVSLTFKKTGTYALSAYRIASDGRHYDISRPFAYVTVTPTHKFQIPVKNKVTPGATLAAIPAQVKNPKAVVKKSSKKKKTVTVSWKKTARATGYEVYLSKKKNKGYKKKVTTKKTKYKIKLAKGTYYVKIRAYTVTGKITNHGAYSKALRLKVK